MEPTPQEKPSLKLFSLMTIVYFGSFFGLKYGILGGSMPWYYNLILIFVCLGITIGLKNWQKTN